MQAEQGGVSHTVLLDSGHDTVLVHSIQSIFPNKAIQGFPCELMPTTLSISLQRKYTLNPFGHHPKDIAPCITNSLPWSLTPSPIIRLPLPFRSPSVHPP